MGLLELINPKISKNPVYRGFDSRRNAIGQFGLGMIGGGGLDKMRNATLGGMQGRQADSAYALEQQKQRDAQAGLQQAEQAKNQTMEWMRTSAPQSFAQLQAGLPMNEAFKLAQQEYSQANAPQDANDPKFGLSPIYGTDAEGNPVIGQLNNAGEFQNTQLPEGFNISRDPIKMDAGTHFVLLDPITRQVIGNIPKENQQEAFDTASGKAFGAASAENTLGAPVAISNAETMIKQIDEVINDPNLGAAVGLGGLLPAIPNTAQAGTVARIEQLQGAAFLQAFETLKGGGQITEIEGQKATNAIARLQRPQTQEDFVTALNDLKDVVNIGLARAKSQLQGSQPVPAPQNTGTGTTSTGLNWSIQ